jgi:hydrogenase expression/formation protein HypE
MEMTVGNSASGSDHVDRIVLAHGGGGELTSRLIANHVLPELKNDRLGPLTDSAILPWEGGSVVFTTDSYVVTPLEFPGGDIGRLAVCGTVNDLSVMGATPIALSLGLILEEGLPLAVLDRIIATISATAREAGVEIVTGDTKVIERRAGDGLFINTAGVGRLQPGSRLDLARVEAGDVILVNGNLADHGLTIMSVRSDIRFDSELRSDAAPLNGLIETLLRSGADVKFLRDATRGGVAGVLADISERSGLSIEIREADIPITRTARSAAEMLGLDPITVANEGKCVCVVAGKDAKVALDAMRSHPLGKEAAVIGCVTKSQPALVELHTRAGGQRIVQRPYGEELPRIC